MILDWYDTETTGIRKDYDQIIQLASVQTDEDLNIIKGSESNLISKLKPDIIPHPKAFLTHKLDLDEIQKHGISEMEMAQKVHKRLMNGNICLSGYNTMAYDDEMLRRLFFRMLHDPYEHEFKNFNSRFDAFKLVELCHAFSPEVLSWPLNDKGEISLKLELLSKANGITHENAHEAISDVYATIDLVRIIKNANPKVYDYLHGLKNKAYAKSILSNQTPVGYASGLFGKENNRWSLVLPMIADKVNANQIICIDLRHDPSILMELSPEEISHFIFTRSADLPADAPKLPVLTIACNKLPPIVESQALINKAAERNDLDLDKCHKHAEMLANNKELKKKLQDAFSYNKEPLDTYESLYSGSFFSNRDSSIKRNIALLPVTERENEQSLYKFPVFKESQGFDDKRRMFDLILRAKWNTHLRELIKSKSYDPIELFAYTQWLKRMSQDENAHGSVTLSEFKSELADERLERVFDELEESVMEKLDFHVSKQAEMIDKLSGICQKHRYEIANQAQEHWELAEECLSEQDLAALEDFIAPCLDSQELSL